MSNDTVARWVEALRTVGVELRDLDGRALEGPALVRAYAVSVAVLCRDEEEDGNGQD